MSTCDSLPLAGELAGYFGSVVILFAAAVLDREACVIGSYRGEVACTRREACADVASEGVGATCAWREHCRDWHTSGS